MPLPDPSLVWGCTALVERVGALAVTLLEYVRDDRTAQHVAIRLAAEWTPALKVLRRS